MLIFQKNELDRLTILLVGTIMEAFEATTTVKRMESDLVNMLREKFQNYSEQIFQILNVELVIEDANSTIVDFTIPETTIRVRFSPTNESYGVKLFDGQDFAFIAPGEFSTEENQSFPYDEKHVLELSDTQIRMMLNLLKTTIESLESFVSKQKEQLQTKLDIINQF